MYKADYVGNDVEWALKHRKKTSLGKQSKKNEMEHNLI